MIYDMIYDMINDMIYDMIYDAIYAGVNILHKLVKLFPDGHFQAHKLFPEMMRKSRLFMGYLTFILSKF